MEKAGWKLSLQRKRSCRKSHCNASATLQKPPHFDWMQLSSLLGKPAAYWSDLTRYEEKRMARRKRSKKEGKYLRSIALNRESPKRTSEEKHVYLQQAHLRGWTWQSSVFHQGHQTLEETGKVLKKKNKWHVIKDFIYAINFIAASIKLPAGCGELGSIFSFQSGKEGNFWRPWFYLLAQVSLV